MFSPAMTRAPPSVAADHPPAATLFEGAHLTERRHTGVCAGRVRGRKWICHTISKSRTHDYSLGIIHDPVTDWEDKPSIDLDEEVGEDSDIPRMINEVKGILGSMDDGDLSVSAYDTAWVALVRSGDGTGDAQFHSSLGWIADHQLPDGSWGYDRIFSAHDRMISTLACVIALQSWSSSPEKCGKGLNFLRENMWRLGEEEEVFMPIGFEVAFPSLLEIAKELGVEIPYDHPVLKGIYAKRDLKMKRIPKDVMHKVPTTLLHSLEGMPGLDWGRLLGLQCRDGSFLFSPSSTAYALMQTGDTKCLNYLNKAVEKFNGGVPNVYPVDLFERLWAVDRLERLGISRYFQGEVKECMEYVHRYWTEDGICWARNTRVQDVDDTAMGFRLLRLHGYDVSTDVFSNFEKDGEFFCFVGQSNMAVTGMYNLNRASQVMFAGEDIMERAKRFSCKFLREQQSANQLVDKWIITKDLPGEVEYTLDFPWYASLPRVEARVYIEQYGGRDDVWIGKTLYVMPRVNNDLYLELAKADFNRCQAVHQLELLRLQRWYEESSQGLGGMYSVNWASIPYKYFLAAACIFEPERSAERIGWAWTAILAEAVSNHLSSSSVSETEKRDLITDYINSRVRRGRKTTAVGPILHLIDRVATALGTTADYQKQQQIRQQMRQAWKEWLVTWSGREEGGTALLLVRTVEACGGRSGFGEPVGHPVYERLVQLVSSICHRTSLHKQGVNLGSSSVATDATINSEMQELVRLVLQSSDSLSNQTKQTFLSVAKSYYYAAHGPSATLDTHISKVLFERVV